MSTGLLNPTHIAILLIVVLIVLGPKKLPDVGRSLGRGMREFKDGVTGHDDSPAEMPPVVAAAPPSAATAAPLPQRQPAGSAAPKPPSAVNGAAVELPTASSPVSSDEKVTA